MSTPTTEELIAAELVTARRTGGGLTGFPGPAPAGMIEAYRIQDAAIARWPDTLVGWKIGYIPADRRAAGEPDRLVGPIWRSQCRPSGPPGAPIEMGVFASGFAAVEAELVLRLGQNPPFGDNRRWTAEQAAALEQELLVGVEIASSPIPDINDLGPTVIASDFGNNNGLVLGPVLSEQPGRATTRLFCYVEGQLVGEGSPRNLPGGIHHALATALTVLAARGHHPQAGMLFATGAITGIHQVRPGQACRVEVLGGPTVEVRTAEAGPARTSTV